MTREEIIKLAREAGLCTWEVVPDDEAKKLEHFAGLIVIVANTERDDDYASVTAAEREACARLCEDYAEHQQQWGDESSELRAMGAREAADAIRARGKDA